MSDDDVLKPGAIQIVLEKIIFNYSLIIVNAEVRNTDLSKVIDQRRLRISHDRIYAPHEFENFFIETGDFLTFIGCVIIKKSFWDEREKGKYFGSSFIHVGVIFQKPFPADILVIAEPYLEIRYGNAEWSPRAFEIWLFKWPQLIWSFANMPDEAKKRVTPKEAYLYYLRIMLYRAKGGYSINEYRKFIEPKLKSKRDKFILQMIARTPGILLNFAGLFYYSFICTKTGLGLIDMRNSKFYYKNYFKNIFARK
jgi:abequosyltransferase